jgi:hypothetical protein
MQVLHADDQSLVARCLAAASDKRVLASSQELKPVPAILHALQHFFLLFVQNLHILGVMSLLAC